MTAPDLPIFDILPATEASHDRNACAAIQIGHPPRTREMAGFDDIRGHRCMITKSTAA
jgi:hypothetical protein